MAKISSCVPIWVCRLSADAVLAASSGEACRLVKQGWVKTDGENSGDLTSKSGLAVSSFCMLARAALPHPARVARDRSS